MPNRKATRPSILDWEPRWNFTAMRAWAEIRATTVVKVREIDPAVAAELCRRLVADRVRKDHPTPTTRDSHNTRGALTFLLDEAIAKLDGRLGK